MRISAPYKFVSKEFRKGTVGDQGERHAKIGGDEFVMMAGPCSVESEKQIMDTAEGVAAAGAPRSCAAAPSSRGRRPTISREWNWKA